MVWQVLFESPSGLASLAVIVGVVVIAVGMGVFYTRRMEHDARNAGAE
ncbi:MAG TPA: DUF3149 domain-containing protein [Rhodocyclaceae bacterium]|nr:DUF3149 domain-containing protein [Rhodocyclaceae bacterium]